MSTVRQILQDAFERIRDEHGLVLDTVSLEWINTSEIRALGQRQDYKLVHIKVAGKTAR